MKKKIVSLLVITVLLLATVLTFASCASESIEGRYYKYNGDVKDGNNWYEIQSDGKWTNQSSLNGTYTLASEKIELNYNYMGNPQVFKGTYEGGVIKIESDDQTTVITYKKDSATGFLFNSFLTKDAGFGVPIEFNGFLLCIAASLILGFAIAISYYFNTRGKCTKSFITTLALLPFIVMFIIMIATKSFGVTIALAGTFALVRFRSVPGTSREILHIMIAMTVGFLCGVGLLPLAILLALVGIAGNIIFRYLRFGRSEGDVKDLRIIVPESLNFTGIFDELLGNYTKFYELYKVRTTNMGAMYSLQYRVILKDSSNIKEFIDDIRTRNGNLTVSISDITLNDDEQL